MSLASSAITGELRAVLTTLALPPLAVLLPLALGLMLAATVRHRRKGLLLSSLSLLTLWLLSTHAVAIWLSTALLASYPTLTPADVRARGAQAVVVLGGGILPIAPEYGNEPQPNLYTAPRITYGVYLARATGLPLAYTGGVGHGASDGATPEGDAMARFAQRMYGVSMRWVDNQARDTAENGLYMAQLLHRDGVRRVALVTHGFHMQRSILAFERAGLQVIPAPTALLVPIESTGVEWLPSAMGLQWSRLMLREWLGLQVARSP